MADEFLIVPYRVRAAGTDVPPEEVQAAINSLAQQTTIALNDLDTGAAPSGPAGGDLGGTYPNPTVVALHVTSGTESGVTITSSTIDSTPVGTAVPSTVAATSVFAGGGAVPAVTATGTQVYNSPNPTVQFIDSIRSAGNKNAYVQWGATVLAMGFANDAFTGFLNAFTITGGFTSGISGITSTSGSGAWAHTGGFSATGGINSTAIGATTPSTGAFTTLTATTPVGVVSGGTGRNTLTLHGVLIGETTGAINQTVAGTTGQMLLGVTGADPAFGNNPTITGGTVDGAVIGGTTRAAGSFTSLSTTGTYTPSSTAGIAGTTTNDNANTGSIGEFIAAVVASGSPVPLTTATAANVTSISLTAGDWDVRGQVAFLPAGSTVMSSASAFVSTVSATFPANTNTVALQHLPVTFGTGQGPTLTTGAIRLSLAITTTVFLEARSDFTVSTNAAYGNIGARRVR